MAVKLYQRLKQDLTQLAAWVRGQYAKKDEVKIFVGTCGTAAGTAAKVVSVDAFPTVSSGGATLPVTGTVIAVKFSNTNTAGSPTLNVNGTGAASIWYGSAVYGTGTPTVAGSAGQYTFFVWNGTYWVWQGQGIASSGGGGGSGSAGAAGGQGEDHGKRKQQSKDLFHVHSPHRYCYFIFGPYGL